MPRMPYVPNDLNFSDPQDRESLDRIRKRRGSPGLLELDRMLLHSPPVAGGWNELLGAIRSQTTLSDDVREVIICRVAALNKAQYEWDQHAPLLRAALSHIAIDGSQSSTKDQASKDLETFMSLLRQPDSDDFSKLKTPWAVKYHQLVPYVDAMTRDIHVPDEIFKRLRSSLPTGEEGQRQMVELTATCASYNCVSRFLVALQVGDVEWEH